MIDLRSDTVTTPCQSMREAMDGLEQRSGEAGELAQDLEGMIPEPGQGAGPAQRQRLSKLGQRQGQLGDELGDLEGELESLDKEVPGLKDKLGDWANASSEVEFCGAQAWRVGEEGRGVATIIGMVMMTRLDCMLGAAAEMRMALAQALHHARHRRTFGRLLVEHPAFCASRSASN